MSVARVIESQQMGKHTHTHIHLHLHILGCRRAPVERNQSPPEEEQIIKQANP